MDNLRPIGNGERIVSTWENNGETLTLKEAHIEAAWPVGLEHAFSAYVAQLREAIDAEIALGEAYPTVDVVLRDSHPAVKRHDRTMGRAMSLLRDLEAAAHREGIDRARRAKT